MTNKNKAKNTGEATDKFPQYFTYCGKRWSELDNKLYFARLNLSDSSPDNLPLITDKHVSWVSLLAHPDVLSWMTSLPVKRPTIGMVYVMYFTDAEHTQYWATGEYKPQSTFNYIHVAGDLRRKIMGAWQLQHNTATHEKAVYDMRRKEANRDLLAEMTLADILQMLEGKALKDRRAIRYIV